MKVLFVENRYTTLFWEAIGYELEKEGHTVYWIVQNHYFAPKNFKNVFVIPYFKGKLGDISKDYNEGINKKNGRLI